MFSFNILSLDRQWRTYPINCHLAILKSMHCIIYVLKQHRVEPYSPGSAVCVRRSVWENLTEHFYRPIFLETYIWKFSGLFALLIFSSLRARHPMPNIAIIPNICVLPGESLNTETWKRTSSPLRNRLDIFYIMLFVASDLS